MKSTHIGPEWDKLQVNKAQVMHERAKKRRENKARRATREAGDPIDMVIEIALMGHIPAVTQTSTSISSRAP